MLEKTNRWIFHYCWFFNENQSDGNCFRCRFVSFRFPWNVGAQSIKWRSEKIFFLGFLWKTRDILWHNLELGGHAPRATNKLPNRNAGDLHLRLKLMIGLEAIPWKSVQTHKVSIKNSLLSNKLPTTSKTEKFTVKIQILNLHYTI